MATSFLFCNFQNVRVPSMKQSACKYSKFLRFTQIKKFLHFQFGSDKIIDQDYIINMIQAMNQTRHSLITRSIKPSLKLASPKRTIVQPNPIFISDYSNTNHQYQRKKKRCPLFLMSKKTQKKKNNQNPVVFTNQGILIQPSYSPIKTTALDCKRSFVTSRPKCPLSAKRQTLSSAFKFTRPITPKKMESPQDLGEFPLFYFYPKERCLQSIQADRQRPTKIIRNRRSLSSFAKQKLKSEGNEISGKELGAWMTKEVQFDEMP